jgi:hypothetical protein
MILNTDEKGDVMRIAAVVLSVFGVLLAAAGSAEENWLSPGWKKMVVVFEQLPDTTAFVALGSGFVVEHEDNRFLVTTRGTAEQGGLFVRLGLRSRPGIPFRYSIDEMTRSTGLPWLVARDADVAVIPLVLPVGGAHLSDSLDVLAVGTSSIRGWDSVQEGDDVYILGFPLAIGAGIHSRPVVRAGTIALKEREGEFLVDANVHPGNTGGPVFLKLYEKSKRTDGRATGTARAVVGILSAYVPYPRSSVSTQTGRVTLTSEVNSGLVIVYSADTITALLGDYVTRYDLAAVGR